MIYTSVSPYKRMFTRKELKNVKKKHILYRRYKVAEIQTEVACEHMYVRFNLCLQGLKQGELGLYMLFDGLKLKK